MSCSDKGETPPPLPLKGNTADYGNLLDNQDLTSPSTPPPPPPHQRVGVLIRDEELLNDAWHFQWNRNPIHTLDIQVNLLFLMCWCFSSSNFTVLANAKRVSGSRLVIRSTLLLSVLSLSPVAPPPPPSAIQGSDMIDWMITLPLTSIRISPAGNQRLISFVHASRPRVLLHR